MPSVIQSEDIPQCLRRRRQWLPWAYTDRQGRKGKLPIDPSTGLVAKWSDPSVFVSFNKALTYASQTRRAGIQFFFSSDDPYVGIDLDSCRYVSNGKITSWAQEIVDYFATYCEVSPSGTGLKLVMRASKPDWAGCKVSTEFTRHLKMASSEKQVEIMTRDRKGGFCLTGVVHRYEVICNCHDKFLVFCERYWRSGEEPTFAASAPPVRRTVAFEELPLRTQLELKRRLGIANYCSDQSACDFGLCCWLWEQSIDPAELWHVLKDHSKFARAGHGYFDRTRRAAWERVQPRLVSGVQNGSISAPAM